MKYEMFSPFRAAVAVFILAFSFFVISCSRSNLPEVVMTPLDTETDFCCRAVSAVSDEVVWASGSGGTVIKTTDGGAHWKKCPVPAEGRPDFRCLHAWNADSAVIFAVGNPAVAFKTTDGGNTWKTVYYKEMPGIFINSMDFKDARCGAAVGDQINGRFFMLSTRDGGDTWEEMPAPEGEKGEGGFAASNTCIQYLPSGKIVFITGVSRSGFYTAPDSKLQWEKYPTGIVQGGANGCDGIYTVYMKNDLEGVAAGGNYRNVWKNEQVAAFTRDGGKTWMPAGGAPHGFISCIKPFPATENTILFATGSDGCSVSYDSGAYWTAVTGQEREGAGFHAADAAEGGNYIYAAGDRGKMARIGLKTKQ